MKERFKVGDYVEVRTPSSYDQNGYGTWSNTADKYYIKIGSIGKIIDYDKEFGNVILDFLPGVHIGTVWLKPISVEQLKLMDFKKELEKL